MNEYEAFKAKFKLNPAFSKFISCEREVFLSDGNFKIIPDAENFLSQHNRDYYSYELSACQIEYHIGPVQIWDFHRNASEKLSQLMIDALNSGHRIRFDTVGPEDVPLDVYPDPTGRYQVISNSLSNEILSAACRVTGTHFHIGMPDIETMLRVYNHVVSNYFDKFLANGDLSEGQRFDIYKIMAPDFRPQLYENWEHVFESYKNMKCVEDLRKCWNLIRMTKYGTIEFRMFDSSPMTAVVSSWAQTCHRACSEVM